VLNAVITYDAQVKDDCDLAFRVLLFVDDPSRCPCSYLLVQYDCSTNFRRAFVGNRKSRCGHRR
jgi:hypothetical protein